jgi:hypothetical protein
MQQWIYCSNQSCKWVMSLVSTCVMPHACPNCGGTWFQTWEPGTFPVPGLVAEIRTDGKLATASPWPA